MSPDQLIKGVITELVLIIAAARIFGIAFRKFGLPQVCGEIAAGIALGPSIFGALFPGAAHYIFNPAFSQVFTALSQLGLVLLMFVIGLDFDFSHLRASHHGVTCRHRCAILPGPGVCGGNLFQRWQRCGSNLVFLIFCHCSFNYCHPHTRADHG
jgi:hypothetical protein